MGSAQKGLQPLLIVLFVVALALHPFKRDERGNQLFESDEFIGDQLARVLRQPVLKHTETDARPLLLAGGAEIVEDSAENRPAGFSLLLAQLLFELLGGYSPRSTLDAASLSSCAIRRSLPITWAVSASRSTGPASAGELPL